MAAHIAEVVTTGIDETLQGIGGDPYGGGNRVGLRVPTQPTSALTNPLSCRYLFNLAAITIPPKATGTIMGWKQMVTLGLNAGTAANPRVVEQIVTTPFWKFPDGNISWHLMNLGSPNQNGGYGGFGKAGVATVGLTNTTYTGIIPTGSAVTVYSSAYRWSVTPALLYEQMVIPNNDPFYVDLVGYTPPFNGRPPGQPILRGMGDMLDERVSWGFGSEAWHALGIPIKGPATIALFASVRQSNPSTRQVLPQPALVYQNGMSPEESFLLNYPNAIYWSVAGGLTVSLEENT